MNWVLKINNDMADYIFSNRHFSKKDVEYRKQNKAYIKQGDNITFISLDCKQVYGIVKVEKVNLILKETLPLNMLDKITSAWQQDTYFFIRENYKDEQVLLEFEIKEETK